MTSEKYFGYLDAETTAVFERCHGDHTRECCWNAVMAVDENASDSGIENPEHVQNALEMIDSLCACERN